MASAPKKTSEFPVVTSLTANDRVVALSNVAGSANTVTITLANIFGNSSVNVVARFITTPANSTATTVKQGTVLWDTSFIYVATANNVLKRAALSTF